MIKWTDSMMQMHEMHLIDEMSPYWKRASNFLGLASSHTRMIEMNHHSVEDCCREVMVQWLSVDNGVYNYPKSWNGLCELLEHMELSVLAYKLQGQSKTLLFFISLQWIQYL